MSNLVNSFFAFKTVQVPYNFIVEFELSNTDIESSLYEKGPLEIFHNYGNNFPIKPWHVKSVNIPGITAKSEQQKIGQFTINHPMLEFETTVLKITFEEDELGTIAKFAYWLARRRMNTEGLYYDLSQSSIGTIVVKVFNPRLHTCIAYRFYDCCFMSSTGLDLTYESIEPTSYEIEFVYRKYDVTDVALDETFSTKLTTEPSSYVMQKPTPDAKAPEIIYRKYSMDKFKK